MTPPTVRENSCHLGICSRMCVPRVQGAKVRIVIGKCVGMTSVSATQHQDEDDSKHAQSDVLVEQGAVNAVMGVAGS